MKNNQYTREMLLNVIYSYKRMIERNKNYPTALINDLEKSIDFVLKQNDNKEDKNK